MKTRPYHHGDLRTALLTLAEDTLRDRGAAELSLRELAREAGVSPAAPSRHFKTKQALLDALALEGFDRLDTVLTGALDGAGDDFASRLDRLTRAYMAFSAGNAALLELMYARKHDPDVAEELKTATRRMTGLVNRVIEDGQRRGEVRAGEVELMVVPLAAALQGLTALLQSGGFSAEQVEQGLHETIAFIQRGYAP
ncbi:TetR/AcrR family transcriptional regulator [Actinoplanes derwentensis]|uniref:DNA-binding transcriptional regulator, AcrR family n=1 Tax=Actinoplanes derwentensis TaxID=113562 RepID=A0A1H1YIT1_9ACTN|nr:TetR/AcrR family transcriptional regulator [Actinoplanes derwentensis]GID81160.1 TetR family transcriptional regulator [Actinoplanes derwentensis]SDT21284.1 DNA-binding transcriptional regulator, AcrR family [Actinoplanes derwentensis]